MKKILHNAFVLTTFLGLAFQVPAWAQQVNDETNNFDVRHKQCLERIADDEELAYEEALIWQSQGGGRRARHCVAMALFALGHADEAAYRLEKLARAPDGGSPQMRVDFYAESADLWLKANLPHKAYFAATSGLKLSRADANLRIVRARAYAAMERWSDAKIDLSSVLAFEPDNAEALRYRADIYRRDGNLRAAQKDIERALELDGKNIDTLLVRGEINEALRLANLASEKSNTP